MYIEVCCGIDVFHSFRPLEPPHKLSRRHLDVCLNEPDALRDTFTLDTSGSSGQCHPNCGAGDFQSRMTQVGFEMTARSITGIIFHLEVLLYTLHPSCLSTNRS